ncbi:protein FAM49A isoform X1 [Myripristis murdjan]|uniref:protein FAM49A isoform X1 n=1 Tax=Myripristis murdjan TaxID=586833 RepID=UPI0011760F79|nr:protein FAM49A-like isoform X1 [Myripristis murdjan]
MSVAHLLKQNQMIRVGLKNVCVHVAMLHPEHTSTMPSPKPLLIQSPAPTPSALTHTHTHTTRIQLTHTLTHTDTDSPDTHPVITHRLLPSLCSRGLMGNLLKVLACAELEHGPIVFLDFEHAQPTEAETAVWNQVSAVLEEAHGILAELQSYNGAGQEIREAIQNPGDLALQEKAWNAVCPLVAKLKRFYEFSLRLENALRSLLEALTSPPYAPMQHLEREQALAKQFAEILHFTLSFDELKMTNPAIQNDFSYYRRTISRNRLNNQQLEAENEVNNEMANRMSLFYAEATPMLKTLSNATTKFVSENKTLPIEDTTDCLSTMACVCRVMLETPEYRCRFTNTDTMLFCMRVMVGVIILYDHVHPVGAFAKTSKIDMKGCIKVLKEQPSNSVEGLLNALRYTTRHLNDDSTSKQIRALLQ